MDKRIYEVQYLKTLWIINCVTLVRYVVEPLKGDLGLYPPYRTCSRAGLWAASASFVVQQDVLRAGEVGSSCGPDTSVVYRWTDGPNR